MPRPRSPSPGSRIPDPGSSGLARRLNVFDATMLVMGGIVGAGIFINPYVVARAVHSPALILLAWAAGGAIALAGGFIYAELAQLRPEVGGQYAYLRDAFHPLAAFLYGWTLLLVMQTGGMAAVAMTFANYFRELTGVGWSPSAIAVAVLAVLTIVNCLGVRSGSNVQSALMVLKILAILMLVVVGGLGMGDWGPGKGAASIPAADLLPPPPAPSPHSLVPFLAALVPVVFAYGGWQTASFVSGEMKNPTRDLPRGMLWGVIGVVILYLAVNVVCLGVLGPDVLARTRTPASLVMRLALGTTGARLIAAGIAVSTVGFLSQGMLTAPRVYFAMARDGVFFRSVGWLDPRSRAPVVAIALQGVWAAVIALMLPYEKMLSYVIAIDSIFWGLTGAALLVFRRRAVRERTEAAGVRVPGHPWTTIAFVAFFWILSANTIVQNISSSGVGLLILLAGVPAFFLWRGGAKG